MTYAIDTLLIIITLFFLFLPITDRKTMQMKLGMIAITLGLFTASVVHSATAISSGQAAQAVAMNNR